jgi:hypothetical protein
MKETIKQEGIARLPQRKRFCVSAKLCSQKATTIDEARVLCEMPREPKPRKVRRNSAKSCEKEVQELARCMADKIDMNLAANINSVEMAIVNAMIECKCQVEN